MSEAPRSTAWRDELVDELDDGRVFGGLVQRDDLGAVVVGSSIDLRRLADDVFEPVQARDQRGDVVRRRDRDADLVAGHDRDVVDREHVRRVGHRDQQRALVGERHRHRLVALGDGRADEVGGGHVHREDAEVEVVEPVALGQRARERVLRERAALRAAARSGVVPEMRELSSASSTCLREARPMSTITSVRKRCEEPRREGLVMPV